MEVRKKPVVVNAWPVKELLVAANSSFVLMPKPVRDSYERGEIVFCSSYMEILTLEGHMRAEQDDFVICGVQGELYPCKPDIFWATYEGVK